MAATSNTNQSPQPIIDLILADINAVIPNFSSLVASYRLLVGASEEFHRIPDICPEVFERAATRADNAGTLIDIFLELLCCKIAFSSEFLKISCAPVDLFRLLANRTVATDTPLHTAEQVVEMEALRRILNKCHHQSPCLPQHNVVCPKPPDPVPASVTGSAPGFGPIPGIAAGAVAFPFPALCSCCCSSPCCCSHPSQQPSPPPVQEPSSDIQQVETAILLSKIKPHLSSKREPPVESRVRRKHLKDAYDIPSKPNRK